MQQFIFAIFLMLVATPLLAHAEEQYPTSIKTDISSDLPPINPVHFIGRTPVLSVLVVV